MAGSFLDKLFSLFVGSGDPEAAKKRRMKQLTKELSSNKFSRFYHPKTSEVDPALGKLFYDIYKVISPAQIFLQSAAKSAQLKQVAVESFFEPNMQEVRMRLTEDAINEKAKTVSLKDLGVAVKSDLATLSSTFDKDRVDDIDNCYNNILSLIQFVEFDFFLTLKKFDPNLPERNFSVPPKLAVIRGEYITDLLKDFLDAAFGVDADKDWKNVMHVLKIFKNGVDIIAVEQWNKLVNLLNAIRKSGILELMIKHIDQKPDWFLKPKLPDEHIAETYMDARRTEAKAAIKSLVNAKRNAQIGALAHSVFGTVSVDRTKYYTVRASEIYEKKDFDGFLYAIPINYLKAFLIDIFKKEYQELDDILVIRGQWTDSALSHQTSEHYNRLMDLSGKLVVFDESLSDSGSNGSRLKNSIVKADRDRSQSRYVATILNTVNDAALDLMKTASMSLITIGKSFKMLLDDLQKPKHEMVLNWKELEGLSEAPLADRIAEAYKKIYYFVQIMQTFAASANEEEEE